MAFSTDSSHSLNDDYRSDSSLTRPSSAAKRESVRMMTPRLRAGSLGSNHGHHHATNILRTKANVATPTSARASGLPTFPTRAQAHADSDSSSSISFADGPAGGGGEGEGEGGSGSEPPRAAPVPTLALKGTGGGVGVEGVVPDDAVFSEPGLATASDSGDTQDMLETDASEGAGGGGLGDDAHVDETDICSSSSDGEDVADAAGAAAAGATAFSDDQNSSSPVGSSARASPVAAAPAADADAAAAGPATPKRRVLAAIVSSTASSSEPPSPQQSAVDPPEIHIEPCVVQTPESSPAHHALSPPTEPPLASPESQACAAPLRTLCASPEDGTYNDSCTATSPVASVASPHPVAAGGVRLTSLQQAAGVIEEQNAEIAALRASNALLQTKLQKAEAESQRVVDQLADVMSRMSHEMEQQHARSPPVSPRPSAAAAEAAAAAAAAATEAAARLQALEERGVRAEAAAAEAEARVAALQTAEEEAAGRREKAEAEAERLQRMERQTRRIHHKVRESFDLDAERAEQESAQAIKEGEMRMLTDRLAAELADVKTRQAWAEAVLDRLGLPHTSSWEGGPDSLPPALVASAATRLKHVRRTSAV